MHCPNCGRDINDDVEACPDCDFHIDQLDAFFGRPTKPGDCVVDEAAMLSEEGRERLRTRIEAFKAATGGEGLVLTVESSAPRKPSEHVFYLFNRWQVGGDEHRGWMILLSLEERRVEIEMGTAFEHIMTDAESSALLETQVAPFLAAGHAPQGVFNGCDLLCTVIEHALAPSEEQNT